ncbi:DUF2326 domain-containing protein [Vibrio splendidus]|uniref:DUF2326 domain-containing protein n=1 Tax=Vibrio splendidus TaxID=29497 RepID=UPI000D3AA380|nr:DUF2326 domain-containing protein [Vibrio splendidus]PTP81956.1 hypothetical protein CWO03_22325 [Vibrio splendidus]
MKIDKLYSGDGYFFDEIEFHEGFNVILGEKSETSQKRNGVGKSIAVEFINFALLKDFDKSRLSKLPKDIIKDSPAVMLDITINDEKITIQRSLEEPNNVFIKTKSITTQYFLDDAKKYLLSKMNFNDENLFLSFRDLVNPLTRDERCEFKSIPNYSDTNIKVPTDYKAHLFYLGLDNECLNTSMQIKSEVNAETTEKSKANSQLQLVVGKDYKEAKPELNRLTLESDELKNLIENDKFGAFDLIDSENEVLNSELTSIRRKISSIKHKIQQIKQLSNKENIDVNAVKIIYEKTKSGLGEAIERSLNEVIDFKDKISAYTNNIAIHKVDKLTKELLVLEDRRKQVIFERNLSQDIDKNFEYDISEAIKQLAIKNEKVSLIKSIIDRIELLERNIKTKKVQLEQEKINIDIMLRDHSALLKDFENKILNAHKSIFDDLSASFEIMTNNRKEIVNFDLRIKEDGSHSNERAKVFIYDFSLLLHDKAYSNHLGLLIHDNIFDNDDDTLQKTLNYIESELDGEKDRQYILTLNSDKLSSIDLDFDILDYRRASFTKSSKFLKCDYDEVN